MAKVSKSERPEFVPDEWLYVEADTPEAARRFFGAPAGWPVKFHRFLDEHDTRHPGRVYKLPSNFVVGKG